jgi:hypothetical protein
MVIHPFGDQRHPCHEPPGGIEIGELEALSDRIAALRLVPTDEAGERLLARRAGPLVDQADLLPRMMRCPAA